MVRTCLAASLAVVLLAAPASAADGDAAVTETAPAVSTAGSPEAPASARAALSALYGTLVGLQAYDGWSTVAAVKRGAVETNPVVSAALSNPSGMWALKIASTGGSIYAAETLWRRHRHVEAIATMVAVNGMMVAVAARNGSVMRGPK